jgi:hypothetical protein
MKLSAFLACALLIVSGGGGGGVGVTNALTMIAPASENCGNGIYCAPSQTCMSNASAFGAGLVYACSPLPSAVRCMDARFSCPTLSSCVEDLKCIYPDGNLTDAIVNVDAFQVAKFRDFGSGLKSTALSICGPITGTFRLPNFCTCKDAKFGGELGCTIGLQNYISVGASAWVLPCASPANFGYKAWASLIGMTASIGKTWTASFSTNIPIPGASFEIGVANVGARAMISGDVSQFIISTNLAIGVCAKVNIGFFSKQICNPSSLRWLPITILAGPRFDFSRFCL